MNKEFKYILEPYKGINTRYICPSCGKKNQFARYIDTETFQALNNNVGRCNREVNCGYHYTPKQFLEDNPEFRKGLADSNSNFIPSVRVKKIGPAAAKKFSLIPYNSFIKSLKAYDNNNLVEFLINRIGLKPTEELIKKYYIGTSKHWEGATIFWQIDAKGRIRTGKVMLYDPATGKRVKKPFAHINWIHKIANIKNYNLNQCFFGEHFLNQFPEKQIAIVESEKTALICAAYIPEYNWLASGNLNNLSLKNLQVLKGKLITLYPDAGAYDIWAKKINQFKDIADIRISDLIETRASKEQIIEGYDLADYLTDKPEKFTRAKEFEQSKTKVIPKKYYKAEVSQETKETIEFIDNLKTVKKDTIPSKVWPIMELENYFNTVQLPDKPINLEGSIIINNIKKYITTNLQIVKAQNGNPTFKPYFDRLINLKIELEKLKGGYS